MKTRYIGLSTTSHDPSIAIVDDEGQVLFAEATERFLQNKRAWNAVPDNMVQIGELLRTHCRDADRLVVATSWSKRYISQVRLFAPLIKRFAASYPPSFGLYTQAISASLATTNQQAGNNLRVLAYKALGISDVRFESHDHHLSHAAAACFGSPFEQAACAVVDGFGEGENIALYQYDQGELRKLKTERPKLGSYSASLGTYYSILCAACGFEPLYGEEWKVMGLAPYGAFKQEYYDLFTDLLRVRNGAVVPGPRPSQAINALYAMKRKPETPPIEYADLAYTGQKFFCDRMFELLSWLQGHTKTKNLVLTGGCALNSSCNGQVLANTGFDHLYVPSAPADDGNALGAALLSHRRATGRSHPTMKILSPYLGSTMKPLAGRRLRDFGGLQLVGSGSEAPRTAARLLADGKLLAWVQGPAEWGPRALGNRSILADPRHADIKDRLNERVKFREQFRPFAPSILHEYGSEYFENYQESPYMERTLRFREAVVSKVPGVVHVDGTGRLQSVKREWNARYHALIEAFHDLTGIPLLLNTSLNIMGKPIVHSVEDVLAVFLMSGIDVLVLGDDVYAKPAADVSRVTSSSQAQMLGAQR